MDADKLKERLRKMKALADFGSGGERIARGLRRMGVEVEVA